MSTWENESGTTAGGRHPVDIGHLVMGLVLAGMVVLWGLISQDLVSTADLRWLLPLPWVLAGGAGLVAMALGARRRQQAAERSGRSGSEW